MGCIALQNRASPVLHDHDQVRVRAGMLIGTGWSHCGPASASTHHPHRHCRTLRHLCQRSNLQTPFLLQPSTCNLPTCERSNPFPTLLHPFPFNPLRSNVGTFRPLASPCEICYTHRRNQTYATTKQRVPTENSPLGAHQQLSRRRPAVVGLRPILWPVDLLSREANSDAERRLSP